MITIIRSPIDEYKDAYKKEKFKRECYELLIDSYEKKIKQLDKENQAYKILLKKELNNREGEKE